MSRSIGDRFFEQLEGFLIPLENKIQEEIRKPGCNKELLAELRIEREFLQKSLYRLTLEEQDRIDRLTLAREEQERRERVELGRLNQAHAQFEQDQVRHSSVKQDRPIPTKAQPQPAAGTVCTRSAAFELMPATRMLSVC